MSDVLDSLMGVAAVAITGGVVLSLTQKALGTTSPQTKKGWTGNHQKPKTKRRVAPMAMKGHPGNFSNLF